MVRLLVNRDKRSTTSLDKHRLKFLIEMGNNLKNKKTIVYLTINTVNMHIYVGVHDIDPQKPWDFYLGNGVFANRPSSIKHPKEPFQFAVKKYGFNAFKRITLATFDNRRDALKLEGIIVNEDFIARNDTYNITLGGGDPPRKVKTCYKYSLDGTFIEKYDSLKKAADANNLSTSTAIINAINFKTISAGYWWTDFYVEKLDTSEYINTTQSRKIYMYSLNGKFEKEFDCIMDAVRHIGSNLGIVQRAIKSQTKVFGHYFSLKKLESFKKEMTKKHYNDPIHQYSLSGEYLKSFNSIREVVKTLGKTFNGISQSIKLGSTCGDFQWSWEKVERMPNREKNKHISKRIGQYDLSGNLIKVYDTLRSCRKDFGNVGKVLKGQAKQTKGYLFKYLD